MYTIKTIDPNILKDNSVIEDINQRTTNIYFNINQITKNFVLSFIIILKKNS